MNFDLLVPRSGFWRPTPAGKSPLTVVSCARQPFKPQQMLVPSAKAFVGTFRHFSDSLMHTHRSFTIYGLQVTPSVLVSLLMDMIFWGLLCTESRRGKCANMCQRSPRKSIMIVRRFWHFYTFLMNDCLGCFQPSQCTLQVSVSMTNALGVNLQSFTPNRDIVNVIFPQAGMQVSAQHRRWLSECLPPRNILTWTPLYSRHVFKFVQSIQQDSDFIRRSWQKTNEWMWGLLSADSR